MRLEFILLEKKKVKIHSRDGIEEIKFKPKEFNFISFLETYCSNKGAKVLKLRSGIKQQIIQNSATTSTVINRNLVFAWIGIPK